MKVIGEIHENAFRTLGLKKPSLKLYKKPKAKIELNSIRIKITL